MFVECIDKEKHKSKKASSFPADIHKVNVKKEKWMNYLDESQQSHCLGMVSYAWLGVSTN